MQHLGPQLVAHLKNFARDLLLDVGLELLEGLVAHLERQGGREGGREGEGAGGRGERWGERSKITKKEPHVQDGLGFWFRVSLKTLKLLNVCETVSSDIHLQHTHTCCRPTTVSRRCRSLACSVCAVIFAIVVFQSSPFVTR
jgi:hypothetical protein